MRYAITSILLLAAFFAGVFVGPHITKGHRGHFSWLIARDVAGGWSERFLYDPLFDAWCLRPDSARIVSVVSVGEGWGETVLYDSLLILPGTDLNVRAHAAEK